MLSINKIIFEGFFGPSLTSISMSPITKKIAKKIEMFEDLLVDPEFSVYALLNQKDNVIGFIIQRITNLQIHFIAFYLKSISKPFLNDFVDICLDHILYEKIKPNIIKNKKIGATFLYVDNLDDFGYIDFSPRAMKKIKKFEKLD